MKKSSEQVDLQKRVRELAILNEIGRALSSTVKVNDLMKVIYEQTTRVMEVSAFYIALYIKEKKSLQFIFDVLKGQRQPDEERLRAFGNGRTEYIIRTKKPLLIKSDPQKVYRQLGIVSADQKARATAGVPIIYNDEAIGALVVQSYEKDEAYDEHHIELLSTIASQAAIAIENARMFEAIDSQRQQLARAKSLTDNILNNVKDGLFLLNRELKFESQYSSALEDILCTKKIAGQKISSLLHGLVDKKIIKSMDDFLTLLLDETLDEEMLNDLNPLQHVKAACPTSGKQKLEKYLTFHFKRVIRYGELEHIIGIVNDITEQTVLAKQLEESKAAEKMQMEILFNMLNVDSQLLQEFMDSMYEELQFIEALLNTETDEDDMSNIYRSVHSIKGNASMLQLNFVAESAHNFEEIIAGISFNKTIKNGDFIELKRAYNELNDLYTQMNGLISRIKSFQTHYRPTRKHETDMLFKSLETLCRSIADKSNKKIELNYKNYKAELIPNKYRLILRDIMVQFLRNAVHHGIETEEERKKIGKSPQGVIRISNKVENGKLYVIFEDDGRGLQIEKIKQSAIRKGKYSPEQLDSMNRFEIMELIFDAGLTTEEKSDITAGRGIGMDMIKEKIKKENGQIRIESQENQYTRFEIILDL